MRIEEVMTKSNRNQNRKISEKVEDDGADSKEKWNKIKRRSKE